MKRKCKECGTEYIGLEEYRKHMHGKNNPMYGRLGELAPNYGKKLSEKQKLYLSKIKRGRRNPFYGKTHTNKVRKNISKAVTKRNKENHHMYGKKHTEQTKRRMRASAQKRSVRPTHAIKMKEKWANGDYDDVNFKNFGIAGYRDDLGHLVRSKWEANYCRYLKYKGIRYEYEPQRFKCGKLGSYTPDIWLIDNGILIEIKGWTRFDGVQKQKRNYIRNNYGIILELVSFDAYKRLDKKYRHIIKNWEV